MKFATAFELSNVVTSCVQSAVDFLTNLQVFPLKEQGLLRDFISFYKVCFKLKGSPLPSFAPKGGSCGRKGEITFEVRFMTSSAIPPWIH